MKNLISRVEDFNFSSLCGGQGSTADEQECTREIATYLERDVQITGDSQIEIFAKHLKDNYSQEEVDDVRGLLEIENLDFQVFFLLHSEVVDIINQLQAFSKVEREDIFLAISNPIRFVVPYLFEKELLIDKSSFLEQEPEYKNPSIRKGYIEEVSILFQDISIMTEEQLEGLLHQASISLYRAEGPYSHNIFSFMIVQANAWQPLAGSFVSSLLCFPFVLVSALIAFYGAQKLTARDQLRDLMLDEANQTGRNRHVIGTTDLLRGRNEIVKKLVLLAGRGWSSIAIVGRRGIGKTRVLYELMRADQGNQRPSTITAWISAPSKFEESDFVESILETLSADVENAISQYLGAQPIEVRRLETNATLVGGAIYIVFVFVIVTTLALMTNRILSTQIISTWFPVLLVLLASLSLLFFHIGRLQPVDLSSWLERDRSNNPHTVLLYREAQRVQNFLVERRKASIKYIPTFRTPRFIRFFLIGLVTTIFVVSFIEMFGIIVRGGTHYAGSFFISFVSGLITISLILSQTKKLTVFRGYSLMSLITTYREFVEKVVYRIRAGALQEESVSEGNEEILGNNNGEFEVLICIDELDKIVDLRELRDFLRRMKAVFEIPGVYYYLSISEDAFKALYLGPAEGKNEIDSSFDHIVYIPPVNCDLGQKIAKEYIKKKMVFSSDISHRDLRIYRVIATMSFGVPRDIIRRSDEYLAIDDFSEFSSQDLVDIFRRKQVEIAYSEKLIARAEFETLSESSDIAVACFPSFLEGREVSSDGSSKVKVVLLSIWILCLTSVALELSNKLWVPFSETLRDLGYRIPEEYYEDLLGEIEHVHEQILNAYKHNHD